MFLGRFSSVGGSSTGFAKATAAALLARAGFESELGAGGVAFGGRGVAHQAAHVDEMFLGGGTFFQRGRAPLGNKRVRR